MHQLRAKSPPLQNATQAELTPSQTDCSMAKGQLATPNSTAPGSITRACAHCASSPCFSTCQIVYNALFHPCASGYGTRMSFSCLSTSLSTRLDSKASSKSIQLQRPALLPATHHAHETCTHTHPSAPAQCCSLCIQQLINTP